MYFLLGIGTEMILDFWTIEHYYFLHFHEVIPTNVNDDPHHNNLLTNTDIGIS